MRIAVLGAGVCGLVAAHRLARAGHAVDVYERWPGLGGQAATLDVGDGHRLERYYHHLFTSDRHIAELYAELGMPDAIEWRPSSVAFFARGRLHPFVTPLDLLRFRPLSPLARVRMGAAVLALQRFAGDRAPYEQVTARAWIERRMGREAWVEVWGPLLRGKFGERADQIAMVWLWSKFRLRRSVSGEDVRQERLGYPRESWEPLFDALARSITAAGGRVLTDRPAARVTRAGDGLRRVTPAPPGSFRRGHDPREFDAGRGRAVRPRAGDRAERRLRGAARSRAGGGGGGALPRAHARHRVLRGALPAARARPPLQPVLLDQRRRPLAPVRRADRAHELHRARALRRPALPLRGELPAARPRAARARRRRADRPLRAGPARGQPGVLARRGSGGRGSSRAGRPADRDRRLRAAHPAAAHAGAGTRAGQHDAGLSRGPRHELRRSGWAARPRGRCSRARRRRR